MVFSDWRDYYNKQRPHRALGLPSPSEFATKQLEVSSRSGPRMAPCTGSRKTTLSTTKTHSRLSHQHRAKQWFLRIAELLKRFTSNQSRCPYWLVHDQKGSVKAPSDRQIYIKFPKFWESLGKQDSCSVSPFLLSWGSTALTIAFVSSSAPRKAAILDTLLSGFWITSS